MLQENSSAPLDPPDPGSHVAGPPAPPAPALPDSDPSGERPAQPALPSLERTAPDPVPARGGIVPSAPISARAAALLASTSAEARAHAQRLRDLDRFHVDPSTLHPRAAASEQATAEAACAVALRCDIPRARRLIAQAHTAVTSFPRTLARLEAADLPAAWFTRILTHTRDLPAAVLDEVDRAVSGWSLPTLPVAGFRRRLRLLVTALAQDRRRELDPSRQRTVTWRDPDLAAGTTTLEITGPTPEIIDVIDRLNRGARAVQDAQRHALAAGADQIPFDLDAQVEGTGMPMSLAQLRYAILVHSRIETGGVHVPSPRRRVNLTVPALTLMGRSNAPGLLEGDVPVDAATARAIAGRSDDWHRVLTDPVTGTFLNSPAARYTPTADMIELTHLKTPLCAMPGCGRPSSGMYEVDHIEEYDHRRPAKGGRTTPENLHDLCISHHRLKTEESVDPIRQISGTTRWRIGVDLTVDIPDNTDLATPESVPEFQDHLHRQAFEEFHAPVRAVQDAIRDSQPPPY